MAFARKNFVAKAAGVPVIQVTRALHSGRPTPHAQMRLERLSIEDLNCAEEFDSKGSTLRLRALYAMGYNMVELGEMLDTGHRQAGEIITGCRSWVRAPTHNSVKELFNRLGMSPEPQGRGADNTRARALGLGYLRPIELEEDLIDVPQPWAGQLLVCRASEMAHADQIKSMKAVREGERSELAVAAYEAYKIEYNRRRHERKQAA